MTSSFDQTYIKELSALWQQVDATAHAAIAPIENEADLKAATDALEVILEEIGEVSGHPLDSLARSLIERITVYESKHFPIPDVDGPHMLSYLLEQRPTTQKQLAQVTGIPQSTISELLSRKRNITADHARKLAQFFGVKPGLFL